MSRALSAVNAKPVFPTFSLDSPGKRCMGDTWQSIVVPPPDLGPDVHVYNTPSGGRYFLYRNFITTDNLYHHAVLATFLRATRLAQQYIDSEQHLSEAGSDSLEITIMVRCISPSDPKISYYIADHTHQTLQWFHNDRPKYYNTNSTRMRDCAEYWHHRSKFPMHRHCTQADRAEVVSLLNGIVSNQGDANIDRAVIEGYVRKLNNIPSSPVLTDHQTSTLADIHSEVLKHSLPSFYFASQSFKGKLYKSFLGMSMPRFVHNRMHGNPEVSVSHVMEEHLRHLNRPNPHVHSRIHTGESPQGPLSPSNSNSS
ncbi:unnamed protein product [Rhizoctonia solani]|uniref:Uncharacterized protein n=3 Tax=Rhizoctonia solani TaxID=456999 RepID=A0A8H3AQP8_9AGAM|nr:hypothetical protein RSOL_222640 [Rhizoctonia solani AG-3 Rhs1AP]KEP50197.1 hypothetical protein V565_084790 [Rhizoctonia solani 123E]CAE6379304.1 unnamed protein product [Rhizoctonia solani]CAE6433626.1 unnamed protein product [Rhizoctonia solani]